MSDLSDLVGVLGAIDNDVVGDPDRIADVSRLLCPYRYGAAGWFPVFREWVASRPGFDDEPHPDIPSLDRALENLTEYDESVPEPDLGLRLLALTVLGRTMEAYGPGGDNADLVVRALAVPGLCGDDFGRAEQLLQLLADTEQFPDADAWDEMMHVAVAEGLIAPDAAQPLRCRGAVVDVEVAGQARTATAITTTLVARDLSFDDATAFLDPAEWPNCCPAWCGMKPAGDIGDDTKRYEETIGVRCPDVLLTTCLGFKRVAVPQAHPNLAVLAYRLSSPTPPDCRSDGEVLVDEGSIEVRDRAPREGVSVTTTKRVLFKSVPSDPLAMFSCIFGYADMGDLLVYECARRHGPDKAGKGKKAKKKKVKFDRPPAGDDAGDAQADFSGGDQTDVVGDIATLAKRCINDSAARYRTNMEKAAAGKYTTKDAASDMATVWSRTAEDMAQAVDLGLRVAGLAARDASSADDAEPREAP